ncbi:MAG: helix-turn-helix transcriptional regulator [Flavobacteriaceae bacterium]|nr:helix-turn-helix transcriptional regulator [Flavobacteriaceae bacterium]
MLNYLEITKRIEKIIQAKELTASGFAEKIGVQRSSISHIMSGRNKPSLEFLIKITGVFPEISLSELVYGDNSNNLPHSTAKSNLEALNDLGTDNSQLQIKSSDSHAAKTEKSLIMLYSDGTFEKYNIKS